MDPEFKIHLDLHILICYREPTQGARLGVICQCHTGILLLKYPLKCSGILRWRKFNDQNQKGRDVLILQGVVSRPFDMIHYVPGPDP